jgi:hypothetical protein
MNRELGPDLEKPVFYWCHLTMARTLRLEYPGGVYHVTSQGNARQKLLADAAHHAACENPESVTASRLIT